MRRKAEDLKVPKLAAADSCRFILMHEHVFLKRSHSRVLYIKAWLNLIWRPQWQGTKCSQCLTKLTSTCHSVGDSKVVQMLKKTRAGCTLAALTPAVP